MNWEDERYVRVYTRDTADLLAIGWEGRLVLYELLRKVDRSGILPTGGDLAVIPELLRVPAEVFERGIQRLRARGTIEITDGSIIVRNFVEAQEATASGRARQKDYRDRHRNETSRESNAPLRNVTRSDAGNSGVTPRDSVPDRTVPDRTVPDRKEETPESRSASAARPPDVIRPNAETAPGKRSRTAYPAFHPETKAALDDFHALFRSARGADPTWDGRSRTVLDRLVVAAGGAAEVGRRARIMFASAPAWPATHGGDLSTLAQHFDAFASDRPVQPRAAGARSNGLTVEEILRKGREVKS